jgi:hypothetical protein
MRAPVKIRNPRNPRNPLAVQDPTVLVLLASGTLSLALDLAFQQHPALPPALGEGGAVAPPPLLEPSVIPLESSSSDWIEGAAILAAVAVVVLVSSVTNYQKEQKYRQLSAVSEDTQVSQHLDRAL